MGMIDTYPEVLLAVPQGPWAQLLDSTVAFLPAAADGRAGHRQLKRLLRETWCEQGQASLVGTPALGTTEVVLQWPGSNGRFVELVAAASREWALEPVVLGTASMAVGNRPAPDVLASSGPASLSRAIGQVLGHRPEWEVQHGKTPTHAALSYVEHERPGLVAIPHTPHRRRAHCDALTLAVHAGTPLLLA